MWQRGTLFDYSYLALRVSDQETGSLELNDNFEVCGNFLRSIWNYRVHGWLDSDKHAEYYLRPQKGRRFVTYQPGSSF